MLMFDLEIFLQISQISYGTFIAPLSDSTYEKIKSNIQKLARRGVVLIITRKTIGFKDIEYVFRVLSTLEYLFPILAVLPLQLLSMHIAECVL